MSVLMEIEPRQAEDVVKEPHINFAHGADNKHEVNGLMCWCKDVYTVDATYQ